MQYGELSEQVIACAVEVHRQLGPGLLESAYRACMLYEAGIRGLQMESEVPVPIRYKNSLVRCGYRADLIVERKILVELKAVDTVIPIHEAQLLTYLKLCDLRVGLLLNFNVKSLHHGIRRFVR